MGSWGERYFALTGWVGYLDMDWGGWGEKFFARAGWGVYFYVPRGMVGHGLKLGAPTWGRPYEGWGIYFYVPRGTLGMDLNKGPMWGCPYGVVFGCLISSGRKIFRPGGNCDFKLLFHLERLGMDLNKGRPRGDANAGWPGNIF